MISPLFFTKKQQRNIVSLLFSNSNFSFKKIKLAFCRICTTEGFLRRWLCRKKEEPFRFSSRLHLRFSICSHHRRFLLRAFSFSKEKRKLAAEEDQKNGDDQDPKAVVVKKVAKAVVIHKYPPFAKMLAILTMIEFRIGANRFFLSLLT